MKKNFSLNDTVSWQQQLAHAFNTINALCDYLQIPVPISTPQSQFPIRVPRGFADCMEKGNSNDPLLKQVLPMAAESQDFPDFIADPVGDLVAMAEIGVIHKYQGRALFISTGGCAVHCRYCFRRNFPYSQFQLSSSKQQLALNYLKNHPDIHEIILSGGDPLLLHDDKLLELFTQFNAIPHLRRVRIHSRLPVVLPARITLELINVLRQSRPSVVLVIHCNHPNELSHEVKQACFSMKQAQITLLNQSVLLKDINDNLLTLKALSEKLFDYGVLPYYLHLLDKAKGTAHFEVSSVQAIALIQQLQGCLSGYLVPKLAKEETGKRSKTILL